MKAHNHIDRSDELISIGISLSIEKDINKLMEKILFGAKQITNADGGTLYIKDEETQSLRFEIMHTDSMNVALGGSTGKTISLNPVPLFDDKGVANTRSISAFAAVNGKTVNIPDAYAAEGFDFSGTKDYDAKTGYKSVSFLTVPMTNHENEIIGVLQLINATCRETNKTIPFSPADQRLVEALASQAAVALSNRNLIDALRNLLEKFIEVIATAIDEKSPYTGGHCRRVPEIAQLLAHAVHEIDCGPMADIRFSDEEMYELKIASLLHDCGKISTPIHIVDKGTKLETIYDRVKTIDLRFEVMKKDAEIRYLKARMAEMEKQLAGNIVSPQLEMLERNYQSFISKLDGDKEFIHKCNIGGEFMEESYKGRVHEIASYTVASDQGEQPLLSEEEIYNLNIPKGTLTPEQREIINNHIVVTQRMLQQLPFPKHLKNVAEIAGNHHERMDGKGYPNGLTRDQMSIQARIMGIADIFEALTASDRPYKKAMPLSVALRILGNMKEEGHIDPDLFDVFMEKKIYMRYADQFLAPEQSDNFDIAKLPGYNPLSTSASRKVS